MRDRNYNIYYNFNDKTLITDRKPITREKKKSKKIKHSSAINEIKEFFTKEKKGARRKKKNNPIQYSKR